MSRTVVKKTASALAGLVSVALLLAGCGADAEPDASPSSATSSSPAPTSTTAAPTKSTSPSPTSSAASQTVDPNIPAAARAHTVAGAEAFVRYFFAQLNRSWSTADPSLLPPLSESDCKTCSAFTASAASFRSNNQHYKGEIFSVTSVAGLGKGVKGEEVLVVGKQEPGAIVDGSGTVIQASVRQAGKFVVSLHWTGKDWNCAELQVQK